MKVDIKKCSVCSNEHADIEIEELSKPKGAFTHWHMCPIKSEPELVAIQTTSDGRVLQVPAGMMDAVMQAEECGRFLYLIFRREDDVASDKKVMHLWRANQNFSIGRESMTEVYKLIQADIDKELGPPIPNKLVEATPPPPAINLFGSESKN